MANKYTRKSKTPPPATTDEFVSFWTKAYDALAPYGRAIGVGSGALVVVVVGAWTVDHFVVAAKENATESYGRALRIYEAELLPADDKDKKDKPAVVEKDEKKEDDVPRFKTDKERAEAALAELDKLDKEHGSSAVAGKAQITRAGILYDLGRTGEAQAAYGKALDKSGGESDPTRLLAREGIGLCKEVGGKLDEALADYQELERTGGDAFRDRAMFDEARVQAKKGDKKKAAEIYKEILKKTPQTPLKDDISARLALLEGA